MGRLLHPLLPPMLILLKMRVHLTYMSSMIATSEASLAFRVSKPACVPPTSMDSLVTFMWYQLDALAFVRVTLCRIKGQPVSTK